MLVPSLNSGLHSSVISVLQISILPLLFSFLIFRVYLGKNQLELGNVKPEVISSAPPTGAQGETFIEKRPKQSKEIIDWLHLRLSWL